MTAGTLPRHRRRHGLSLAEVMVSLVICATVLVAVAAAYKASAAAVDVNERFFRATQAARVSMNQVLVEIRRADSVDVGGAGTYVDVIRPAAMQEPNEVYRRFAYDADGDQLTLRIYYADGTSSPPYVIARNVTAATFGPEDLGVDAEGETVVARVPVTITVAVGDNVITLNGSSGPRRALVE